MGTRSFIIIKLRNLTGLSKQQLKEFCLMQFCSWDGYPEGQGVTILNVLRKIIKENRWVEFYFKCSKLERDTTEGPSNQEYYFLDPVKNDDEYVAFEKIKKAFVKHEDKDVYIAEKWNSSQVTVERKLFEQHTASPETLKRRINYMKARSGDTGAKILYMIMNEQVHEVDFCGVDFLSSFDCWHWGYLIDCTTKELLVYSTLKNSSDEKQDKQDEENPLRFIDAIPLVGRFKIDDLPSNEEFCSQLDFE